MLFDKIIFNFNDFFNVEKSNFFNLIQIINALRLGKENDIVFTINAYLIHADILYINDKKEFFKVYLKIEHIKE